MLPTLPYLGDQQYGKEGMPKCFEKVKTSVYVFPFVNNKGPSSIKAQVMIYHERRKVTFKVTL